MERQRSKWGWNDVILVLVALAPIVAGLLLYDRLPEQMTVHFGVNNVPNGFQSKNDALLTFGALGLFVPLLMKIVPAIDPRRENYKKFAGAYEVIRFAITVLLSCINATVLLYNMGYHVNIQMVVMILVGLLFMVLGNYLGQIRFNYFMGIRTPWTLSNEEVWRKTHRLAGPLYLVGGALVLIGAFLPAPWSVLCLIVPAIVAGVIPLIYSYVIFKKMAQ
ncbi:MAG: SdpI family protein [Tumebacillaceae bacterium]